MVLVRHLCLLAFYWMLWQAGSYPVFWHFCQGLGYCTRPDVRQFPVSYGSAIYCCNKCADLYVLVVLQCVVLSFSVFFPPSSLLTIIITIIIDLNH